MPYQSRYSSTLAELLGAAPRAEARVREQQAAAQAEARMAEAQAWGGMTQNMTGWLSSLAQLYAQGQQQRRAPVARIAVPAEEQATGIDGPVAGLPFEPAPVLPVNGPVPGLAVTEPLAYRRPGHPTPWWM